MAALELIDETFNDNRTELYELSVQLRLDGFALAIKDTERNTFIALVDYPLPSPIADHDADWGPALKGLCEAHPYLTRPFKHIRAWYHNAPYTTAPADLVDATNAKQLLVLTQQVPPTFELHLAPQPTGQEPCTTIFAMPSSLAAEWLKMQPNTELIGPMHHLAHRGYVCPWATYLLVETDGDHQLNLTLFSNGTPMATNSFGCQTATDMLYYAVGFCQNLGMQPDLLPIKMVGHSTIEPELVALMKQYFHEVSTGIIYNHALLTYRLNKHGAKYFSLFNH